MSALAHSKRIVIIAGPNGTGKTTFAREFLPTDAELQNFVNADLIAAWCHLLRLMWPSLKQGGSCWKRLRTM